jgi:DnaJ homolog subfamily C member 19
MSKLLVAALIVGAIWWYLRKPARKPLPPRPLPDVAEARAILGVGSDATADDVRAAHRRLVSAVHPDKGGSAELTRRINAARDVLLRRLQA